MEHPILEQGPRQRQISITNARISCQPNMISAALTRNWLVLKRKQIRKHKNKTGTTHTKGNMNKKRYQSIQIFGLLDPLLEIPCRSKAKRNWLQMDSRN